MTVDIFLDTNVIVYAVDAKAATAKRATARQILRDGRFGISTQVLLEFCNATTRRLKTPLPAPLAARWVDRLARTAVIAVDPQIVKLAFVYSQRFAISHWDGAIIAAAEALGASVVLSEDLNHGQAYGSLRVENPFRGLRPR